MIFTSKGSLRSFIKTTKQNLTDINKIKEKTDIVYNTCMLYEQTIKPVAFEEIDRKQKTNKRKKLILTVSSLSTFKGVDRIPKFLLGVENFKKDSLWVLCGEGHLESKISEEIEKYKLKENFIHIKTRIPQIELQYLYKNSCYYLMMHRLSIFDMATLEAMSNGCIPLLTYVGGNVELNKCNNIIYTNENKKIILDSNNQFLIEKGELNKEVFYKHFGPETLLNEYMKVIKSI